MNKPEIWSNKSILSKVLFDQHMKRTFERTFNLLLENLGIMEDRANKAEKELRNFQESMAIQLSSGSRMVDPTPLGIRERIKDVLLELKEKQYVCIVICFFV
jgi:hypothetical protein